MDKRSLSERDICTKFITPAVVQAAWDEMSQIREEVSFTNGPSDLVVRPAAIVARRLNAIDGVDTCDDGLIKQTDLAHSRARRWD